MGLTDWLLGSHTESIKGHEAEFVRHSSVGEQVFGDYCCVECGETHDSTDTVLWSNGCAGPPREDAWVTVPVGVYVTSNNNHERMWGKLISCEKQLHISIRYPRRYEEPEMHETLTQFDEGDYLYATLRGMDDMSYWRVEEFVSRDVVETTPWAEIVDEIDTLAE